MRLWIGKILLLGACCTGLQAEKGVLWLHVTNLQGGDIPGVVFNIEGLPGTSSRTEQKRHARLLLPAQTVPTDWLSIKVSEPKNKYVIVSPLNRRVMVPPFDEKPDNAANIVLARVGDPQMLQSGAVVLEMVVKINTEAAQAAKPDMALRRNS